MALYELIGQRLGHSFSKPIHEALGAYAFHLHELPNEEAVRQYLAKRPFAGCNVTIPYKQTVIPLCDEIDERAARIGAVNTLVNRGGRLTGYNTDYEGFAYMLGRKNISLRGKTVLLLGSGGTCKTAMAVAEDAGAAKILVASRAPQKGQLAYQEAAGRADVEVLINVSPAGMFPNNGSCLANPAAFPNLQAVADVVYNPLKTKLLFLAEELGLPTAGGLPMLVEQAVAAARLYTGRAFGQQETERILRDMYSQLVSLVLVGMPSSGKSRLGKAVARKLHKTFVDLDHVLVAEAGKPISAIFEEGGEEAFRAAETRVLAEQSKKAGIVLSTGGGIVTRPENLYYLRQNGIVFYLDRPLSKLQVGRGRPLSKSPEALAEMYRARRPLYEAAADLVVENNASFIQVANKIVEAYHAAVNP
ncbi:MAG: shikimate kinase [Oscillospiraceae bacterium]